MPETVRLTQYAKTSGCAAKIGPEPLRRILDGMPAFSAENLLVGFETNDDAAVYRLDEEHAVIQTLDFFPPVADDPYAFGQIAAANALSDIYAMGGVPRLALNIVCFPNCLPVEVLGEILRGGADKVKEAGAVLCGGHSIQDDEPKYGLSVTGFVETKRILRNVGAKPGDVLILTKPVGSGLVNTAAKADMVSEEALKEALFVMRTLNKKAAEAMRPFTVHACTDVTGFGLFGHLAEMAEGSGVTVEVRLPDVPLMREAREYAETGLVPEGSYTNRRMTLDRVDFAGAEDVWADLMYDPQTSGGLLFSLPEGEADAALQALSEKGVDTPFALIGRVKERQGALLIRVI